MISATPVQPRRALVLGGGGVLGFAWLLGALAAVQEVTDVDAGDVEVVLGTSAGAVAAGLLGCGLSVDELCRHHQGIPAPDDRAIPYAYDGTGSALPPRPRLRPAAPGLVLDAVRHPRRMSPLVALSGLLPAGAGTLAPIHELLSGVCAATGFADRWPDRPRPWVVAVDHSSGRRVVFGRDDFAPRRDGRPRVIRSAPLADAVTASCSIPGWYPATVIDGVPYVDGGVASNASVDLLRGTAVDEVFVLAPMCGTGTEPARNTLHRVERLVRRAITRTVLRDAAALRAQGARVHVVHPQQAELAIMGVNLMDPQRRTDVLQAARESVAAQLGAQLAVTRLPAPRRRAAGQG
jgi:NTE family protein